jgi:hypothetical protein
MAKTIATLLKRNLHEVFGEKNERQRRTVIAELFIPGCIFSDPRGRVLGHEALNHAVAALQTEFPDYIFTELDDAQLLQDAGRLAWGFGPTGKSPQVTGSDVIVVGEERITALYTFLDAPIAKARSTRPPNQVQGSKASHAMATRGRL